MFSSVVLSALFFMHELTDDLHFSANTTIDGEKQTMPSLIPDKPNFVRLNTLVPKPLEAQRELGHQHGSNPTQASPNPTPSAYKSVQQAAVVVLKPYLRSRLRASINSRSCCTLCVHWHHTACETSTSNPKNFISFLPKIPAIGC